MASLVAGLTSPPSQDGRELRALARVADWLEVRGDRVGDLDPQWLRSFFPGRILYSLRSRAAGGSFDGGVGERTRRILAASRGFDLVELECEADGGLLTSSAIPRERRLISAHPRTGEPGAVAEALERLLAASGRLYKLVVPARRCRDALAPLGLLKAKGRSDLSAFASGECGFWTRLIAPRFGAPLVFAAADAREAIDGERSVEQLIEDYGLPLLQAVSEIYGIVGNPVRHSLSPRIHNAAYRALGYPGLFVPFQVESFRDFWQDLVNSEELSSLGLCVRGLTVASPFKEEALREAPVSSEMAQRIGAANLFVWNGGQWTADTTDPQSAAPVIENPRVSVRGKRAAVVGCGGAGRAIAAALVQGGADVTLVNRGAERGRLAAQLLDLPFVPLSSFTADHYSVIVNATPLGRDDHVMPFDVAGLRPDAIVIDLVYGIAPTPLIAAARAAGRLALDGRDVLEAQVLQQFRFMTGRKMPPEVLRRYLRRNARTLTRPVRRDLDRAKHVKAEDRVEPATLPAGPRALDLNPLLGTWVNTDGDSRGLRTVVLESRDRKLIVRGYGAGDTLAHDAIEVEAEATYAASQESDDAAAFTARYRADGLDARLLASVSEGLLVVASVGTFCDGSRRSSYCAREFFRRRDGARNRKEQAHAVAPLCHASQSQV